MRFSNENYLKAFPRDEQAPAKPAQPAPAPKSEPGSVVDPEPEPDQIEPAADPEPAAEEAGEVV